jgi:hypothetical protein
MLKQVINKDEPQSRGQQILKKLGIVTKPVNTIQELIDAKNYSGTFGTPNEKRLIVK